MARTSLYHSKLDICELNVNRIERKVMFLSYFKLSFLVQFHSSLLFCPGQPTFLCPGLQMKNCSVVLSTEAQTCQMLTGYSNTGRTVIVLFRSSVSIRQKLTSCQHGHSHTHTNIWPTAPVLDGCQGTLGDQLCRKLGSRHAQWHRFTHTNSHLPSDSTVTHPHLFFTVIVTLIHVE